MTFAQPYWLLLLLIIPLVAWRSWSTAAARGGMRFSFTQSIRDTGTTWKTMLRWLPVTLRVFGLTLAILAMARPQNTNVIQERFAEGVDIIPWPGGVISSVHTPADIEQTADAFGRMLTRVKEHQGKAG